MMCAYENVHDVQGDHPGPPFNTPGVSSILR